MQADHAIDMYIIIWDQNLLKLIQYQGKNYNTKPNKNYNSLNLKIVLQICIYTQTKYFLIFKIK